MTVNDSALQDFITRHPRLFVLTGAGCSTDSGIPDYRDEAGGWKRRPPMTYQVFMGDAVARARYWARSMIGWRSFGRARHNAAHAALARLEAQGHIVLLVTQNVDGLHEAAGSTNVLDLHGRLDRVRCMGCERVVPRPEVQVMLESANPVWVHLAASDAPDGDADLDNQDFSQFREPRCQVCGGILKPDVVFFGEAVPRERIARAIDALESAGGMLVVGSSLMVHSGYRYAQMASRLGIPICAVNLGQTRADDLLTLKVQQSCSVALDSLVA
ncbi:NAD-dependent protein deacetylase [Pigmentiphaga litoralis]|nr:NAD-dependent protein deacetylase [Pigmentiphaga litoralis]